MEEKETEEAAAKREASEEAGCEVELVEKIGEDEFYTEADNTRHVSVCFLARKIKDNQEGTNFTEHENKNRFVLKWLPFEEALKLFEGANPKEEMAIKMNKRDYEFLKKAIRMMDSNN